MMSRTGCYNLDDKVLQYPTNTDYSRTSCLPCLGHYMSDNVTWDCIRILRHCTLAHMEPLTSSILQITLPISHPRALFLQPNLPYPLFVQVTFWWYTCRSLYLFLLYLNLLVLAYSFHLASYLKHLILSVNKLDIFCGYRLSYVRFLILKPV